MSSARIVDVRSPWTSRIPADRIEQMTIADLNNAFNHFTVLLSSREVIIGWLQQVGLLADYAQCNQCNIACRLSIREKAINGYMWRCPSRYEISICCHRFFSKSHLHIPHIINFRITYAGKPLWKCAHIARVGYGNRAIDWGSFCRDLFVEY